MDNFPIGIFDSGVGGLTVLRALREQFPHENFIYLGDTARVPYGNKSPETVSSYARQCSAFLESYKIKLIIVACNTASALSLNQLQEVCSVPVIGMIEPAVKRAIALSTANSIGVIGTRGTISSGRYAQAISNLKPSATVHSVACPLLVPLAEEGWFDYDETFSIVKRYLTPLQELRIDTLILGCTHFPPLTRLIQKILPSCTIISCGDATADYILTYYPHLLRRKGHEGLVSFYVTDSAASFKSVAEQFLGAKITNVTHVNL